MVYHTVMGYFLIFSSVVCLTLQAVSQCIGRLTFQRLAFASLLSAAALIQWHFYLVQSQLLLNHPKWFMSYVPLLLFLGPMMQLYFNLLSQPFRIRKTVIAHFIVPSVGVVFWLTHWRMSLEDQLALIRELYLGAHVFPYAVISGVCGLSLLVYGLLILKEQPTFMKRDKHFNKPLLLGWAMINLLFILAMCFSLFSSTVSLYVTHIGNIMCSIVFITVFVVHNRYPTLFSTWLFEIKKAQRTRSYLGDMDPHELLSKIKEMMVEETLFKRPDLSLQAAADCFSLTRYQLSELLNDYAKQSFSDFVASFRIEEAKRLLEQEPWKKIIHIGFEVGFNSQSMFAKSFKKITGTTPSEYQKLHQK